MVVDIFYALMFISIGVALIKYRKIVKGWTGNLIWAEQNLGRGSTYFIIMLVGFFLIFLGVTYPFGGIEGMLGKDEINNPNSTEQPAE